MGSAGLTGHHDEARVRGPGLVIGRSGASFGKVHYCHEDYWPLNTALFATDFLGNEPRFVYYALNTISFGAFNSGSAQASLNRNLIANIPVAIPPLEEQRRIAGVLGAPDHKIDSNRRLAQLLEEIAQAEFQARFVDCIGSETFEDSELGPIPTGWRAGVLGEIGSVHRDLIKGASDSPYVGLDLMPRGSTVLTEWRAEDAPTGQAALFDVGDVLFGKLRPYFRKVGVAPIAGRCSTEILVLRPRKPQYYGVLLGHVASEAFIAHCVAVSRGTRMPRAEWKDAAAFKIAIPPEEVAAAFTALAQDLYAKIRGLIHESRTLASIRDTLLPRLVSGQIRVPDTADPADVVQPLVNEAA